MIQNDLLWFARELIALCLAVFLARPLLTASELLGQVWSKTLAAKKLRLRIRNAPEHGINMLVQVLGIFIGISLLMLIFILAFILN